MSTLMSTLLTGCASPRQWALDQAAVALAAQGADDEDDLQLARDAAAYHLKLTESVLRQRPAHRALATAVSAGFTQYAYAFVAFDADRVQDSDARAAKRLRERAARLYGRARGHAMTALQTGRPGLLAVLREGSTASLAMLAPDEIGLAYWAAAAWAAQIALSTDRPDLVADLPAAVRLAGLAYAAEPAHGDGALASLMGTLEAARPGGTRQRAQAYFEQAQAAGGGRNASVFVAMAESLAQPAGDRSAFEALLRQAVTAADTR